jgi:hypothetical protein
MSGSSRRSAVTRPEKKRADRRCNGARLALRLIESAAPRRPAASKELSNELILVTTEESARPEALGN